MDRGKIVAINRKRGFINVQVDHGDYSVIELLGGYDPELGDVISGNLSSCGHGIILNETQLEQMDVVVQAHGCNWGVSLRLMA